MCGVAGIFRLERSAAPVSKLRLDGMLAALQARGPDGRHSWTSDDFAFGCTRLQIVGGARGIQPFAGCDDGLQAVFNGEIYNHRELADTLHGHRLHNPSDGAVIPHLLERDGRDFAQALNGAFAIAVWDQRAHRLTLVRDRLGIKPLFYAQTSEYFVFASEIKAIVASGLIDGTLDRRSVMDTMIFNYPIPPRTMFEHVREVPPASVIEVTHGLREAQAHRYWALPIERTSKLSFADAAERTRALLTQAVERRLGDQPQTACFLSGGVDSSIISKLCDDRRDTHTFSIFFDDPKYDEREFVQTMRAELGGQHHEITLGKHDALDFPDMIWAMEMPLIFPLALAYQKLAKKVASHGFKFALSGEGADELFLGYDCFKQEAIHSHLGALPARLRKPLLRRLYAFADPPEDAFDFLLSSQEVRSRWLPHFNGLIPAWFDGYRLLKPMAQGLLHDDVPDDVFARWSELDTPYRAHDVASLHPLDRAQLFELQSRLPNWILRIGDRSAMSHGLETRVPFMDHELVEFAWQLPHNYKMRMFRDKAVLRRAFAKQLPRTIVSRPKKPFLTPIREWFFAEDSALADHYLSKRNLERFGLFRPDAVQAQLREMRRSLNHSSLRAFQLEWSLCLALGTQVLASEFADRMHRTSGVFEAARPHELTTAPDAVADLDA